MCNEAIAVLEDRFDKIRAAAKPAYSMLTTALQG